MSPVLLEQLKDDIEVIVKKYCDKKAAGELKTGGDAFALILSLVDEFSSLIETTKAAFDLPGEEKHAFVVECLKEAYWEVDPNLPYIPEPLETIIENWTFKHVVPAAIDWLVAKSNEQGVFTHKAPEVKDVPKGDVG